MREQSDKTRPGDESSTEDLIDPPENQGGGGGKDEDEEGVGPSDPPSNTGEHNAIGYLIAQLNLPPCKNERSVMKDEKDPKTGFEDDDKHQGGTSSDEDATDPPTGGGIGSPTDAVSDPPAGNTVLSDI